MANTLITADGKAGAKVSGFSGPFWLNALKGAVFCLDADDNLDAWHTTDGGATWTEAEREDPATAIHLAAWYDQQTPGNTGSLVHVCWNDQFDAEVKYANFDLSAGTWGSTVTVKTAAGIGVMGQNPTGVVVARDGTIYVWYRGSTSGTEEMFASTDGGASFGSALTPPIENASDDWALGFPANTADPADIGCLYFDASADAISVKMYDASAGTWTETAIATAVDGPGTTATEYQTALSVRLSDSHVIAAFCNAVATAGADLKVYDLTVDSIAAPTITALTDVITDSALIGNCGVFVDQLTDDIYVPYALAAVTWDTDNQIYYKVSTDGGATWGSQQTYGEGTADALYCTAGQMAAAAGRFMPLIYDDTTGGDFWVNLANDVPTAPPAGGGGGGALMLLGVGT